MINLSIKDMWAGFIDERHQLFGQVGLVCEQCTTVDEVENPRMTTMLQNEKTHTSLVRHAVNSAANENDWLNVQV